MSTTRPSTSSREAWLTVACFFVIYVLWGGTYMAAAVAVREIPPFLLVALRTLPAGLLLLALAGWRRERGAATSWRDAAITGGLLFVAGQGAMFAALRVVPTGASAVVVATIPLWVLTIEWTSRRGEVRLRRDVVGVVVGLAGIVTLTVPWRIVGAGSLDLGGTGLLLACAVAWAAGTVHLRRTTGAGSLLRSSGRQLVVGGVGAATVALVLGEARLVGASAWAPAVVGAVLFLALLGSFLGFLSYNWLLARLPATRVASYAYVNPIVALGLGWAFGGEILTPRLLAASVLTIAGVAIVVTPGAGGAGKGDRAGRVLQDPASRGLKNPARSPSSAPAGSPTPARPPGSPRSTGRATRAVGP